MSVLLSNYSNLTSGLQLSNSGDVIANSYSFIEGNEVVNIKDRLVNWIGGDSTGKNRISTGEGILTIAMPTGDRTFENIITVNGPNITGQAGVANFRKKVIMWDDLEVQGAISVGEGVSVLTSDSGYTKDQMNSTFNALNGTVSETETVIIPDLVIIPKAPQETTYTKTEVDTILAQKANDETTYNKTEVDTILTQKANDETTYNKTEVDTILTQKANDETTYNKTQVDSLLDSKEPSFITVAPLLKNLNVETGTIDIILSEAFLSNIDGKVDQSYVDDELATKANTSDLSLLYQAKLKNESSIGYSVLGPDDKTVYSLEASSGIYLLPTYTIVDNVHSNYRIQIRVDELYTAQAQAYTNNAIAAIQSPYWIAIKVSFAGAIITSTGIHAVTTIAKAANGSYYNISFPSHPLGASAIFITAAAEFSIFYREQTLNSIRIYTRTGTNQEAQSPSNDWTLLILA
jgi:hypothetical protein